MATEATPIAAIGNVTERVRVEPTLLIFCENDLADAAAAPKPAIAPLESVTSLITT
jgi:hypothetical protein